MSLPVWEEWIEMLRWSLPAPISRSLPVWEEWIEIGAGAVQDGLIQVSSRMGRVD